MDITLNHSLRTKSKVVDCKICGSEFTVRSWRDRAVDFHEENCPLRQEMSLGVTEKLRSLQVKGDKSESQDKRGNHERDTAASDTYLDLHPRQTTAPDRALMVKKDTEAGSIKLTPNGFLENEQRLNRPLENPSSPEFNEKEKRRSYLNKITILYQSASQPSESDSQEETVTDRYTETGYYLHITIRLRQPGVFSLRNRLQDSDADGTCPMVSLWQLFGAL